MRVDGWVGGCRSVCVYVSVCVGRCVCVMCVGRCVCVVCVGRRVYVCVGRCACGVYLCVCVCVCVCVFRLVGVVVMF